jgi:hypothetical protein
MGDLPTDFGHMEVLLDGTPDAPSQEQIAAFERFAANLTENLLAVRRQIPWSFLYRPIRIAPNRENRVGVQFRHKLTGKQIGMFFWD